MDPYGDYSVYMIDIFGSFAATFVAYLLGVLLVLTLGLQMGRLLDRLTQHKEHDDTEAAEAVECEGIQNGDQ
jgi:hypothetical protein